MAVCESCPLKAALSSAEELVALKETRDMNRALGGISLTKECLEVVSSNIACPGETTTEAGQLDCPLKEMVLSARSMAFAPWNPANFTLDLEKEGQPEQPHQQGTGQYL